MKKTSKKAFSLVELLVVVVIIAVLSGVAYVGIQRAKVKTMNDKVLDDVVAIANALEQYNRDHFGEYPVPELDGNMNINCYYADATYAHDCDSAAFRQGMIDNNLLTRRYMPEVPTDPRTGSRYVYGVSNDGKYFMVAGIFEESNGNFIAKTSGNLAKGYHVPSLIRAFNGPNFVVENGNNLPYSPDHMIISATLQNISDADKVTVKDASDNDLVVTPGMSVYTGYTVTTTASTLDVYYSDGSVSSLDINSKMQIMNGTEVAENDSDGIITKIRVKLFSGKIWNKVARLASASEFNIETTSAIAGVRGTEFGVDADTEDVLLKDGSICRIEGGTGVADADVKNCTGYGVKGSLDVDPLLRKPKIIKLNAPLNTVPSEDIDSNDGLKTLLVEKSKRYLNDNIRPHILKIENGEITIANLNTYYDLPDGEFLEVDGIGAYNLDGGFIEGTARMIDRESLEDYKYFIDPIPTTSFVLRFVITGGPDSGDSIPLLITPETQLTEESLYKVEEDDVIGGEGEGENECDNMAIFGSVSYDKTNNNATLSWSVTPPECFEGAVYNGEFGPIGSTATSFNSELNYHQTGTLTPGSDYEWKVETDIDSITYEFPADGTKDLFTAPDENTVFCGDEYAEDPEECDSTVGCIMTGANKCTCNQELGYTFVAGTGCECSGTATYNLNTTTDVPINGSLIWSVSPACITPPTSQQIKIYEDATLIASGSTTTNSIPLTSLDSANSLIPGHSYEFKIDGNLIDNFTVKCPATGAIANVDVDTTGPKPKFIWNVTPECTFVNAFTTVEVIDNYNNSKGTQSTTTAGDTSLDWIITLPDGHYTYTLTTSNPTASYTDGSFDLGTAGPTITGPTSLALNDTATTITSSVPCGSWTFTGGGELIGIANSQTATYNPINPDETDADIAGRFNNTNKETVTITCTDISGNTGTHGIEITYAPKLVSGNYDYSYTGLNNVDWYTAMDTCEGLKEGGATAGEWVLPDKDFLINTATNWSGQLPGGATTTRFWSSTEDTGIIGNYWFVKNDGTYTSRSVTSPLSSLGYRCIRVTPTP
ncbi:FecR domain-containing protein [Candidatus Peregrinibacteria bacterium]|nr:FecR domain-containing protein [Candidatus Peregrinibacteria bacterium]